MQINSTTPSTPFEQRKLLIRYVFKKVRTVALDATLIFPLIKVIFVHLAYLRINNPFYLFKKVSPLAQERLQKMQLKVQKLAKKAGMAQADHLYVCVGNYFSIEAVVGNCLYIPAERLFKEKHLPALLRIEKKRETWVKECQEWLKEQLTPIEANPLIIINHFKSTDKFKMMQHASIGHELGHVYHQHNIKNQWIQLGWSLLTIPTLGLASIFKKQIFLQSLYHRHEKEADLFSAKKLNLAQGLIDYYKQYITINKLLKEHFLELRIDNEGNNLKDWKHPRLTDRIAYLQPFVKP